MFDCSKPIKFENLGHIDYQKALDYQLKVLEEVRLDPSQERILICSHPSVVTLGKKASIGEIQSWKGPTIPVSRGGKVTYHGPGQVVCYPILDLNLRNRDLHILLRNLDKATILNLEVLGVKAQRSENGTGVWVSELKIASIGIAVKRWVSYHGIAINLFHDPLAFRGISPCGFSSKVMTSLEELGKFSMDRKQFEKVLQNYMQECFHL